MNSPKMLVVAALASTVLFAATHGSAAPPKTLDVRVGAADIHEGKVRAALLSGANQGLYPGDRGYFTKNGARIRGTDFVVDRVSDRVAWTMAPFPTLDAMRWTSLQVKVVPTHTCGAGGQKPVIDTPAAIAGRTPPKGFLFASVRSAERADESTVTFTIDKGTEDGVVPSSTAYALLEGTGMPMPVTVDITWVTKSTAGGVVRGLPDANATARTVRRLGVERVRCSGSE